jgi:hypothetical protein
MRHPKNEKHLQLCLVVSEEGVTAYGNAAAMRTLSRWLAWLGDSQPSDHYECHVAWHLGSPFRKQNRVWLLRTGGSPGRRQRTSQKLSEGYDVTFMLVTSRELAMLRRYDHTGVLPSRWTEERQTNQPSEGAAGTGSRNTMTNSSKAAAIRRVRHRMVKSGGGR